MNDRAVAVGNMPGQPAPVVWDLEAGTWTTLKLPSGMASGTAEDISETGIVVGSVAPANGTKDAARWDATGSPIVLRRPASVAGNSQARAVNDKGLVVGTAGADVFAWTEEPANPLLVVPGAAPIVNQYHVNGSGLVALGAGGNPAQFEASQVVVYDRLGTGTRSPVRAYHLGDDGTLVGSYGWSTYPTFEPARLSRWDAATGAVTSLDEQPATVLAARGNRAVGTVAGPDGTQVLKEWTW